MENLMVQVIQQVKNSDTGDSQKGTDIPLKKCVPESSRVQKNTSTEDKSSRASSFSILRDNVLQYVEDGEWNSQSLQTTTCVPKCSQEKTRPRKNSCKAEQDVLSHKTNSIPKKSSGQQSPFLGRSHAHECPATPPSQRDDLLPLSQSCIQCARHNSSKCPNHRSHFSPYSDHSDSYEDHRDDRNLREIDSPRRPDDVLSSPTSSSDYLTSLESLYRNYSEKLSPSAESANTCIKKSISSDSVDGRTENTSGNGADFTDSESSLQVGDTNPSESEGLSTYTLHSRWQEILPKEVIQQISRDKDTNEIHLLHHVNKENILTASTQYFTDSLNELSDDDAESIVLNYQNNEYNSELCWSTGSISVEESVDDVESSFNSADFGTVAKTSPSFTDSGNSCDSVDEISQNSSSIQDAYRSILKTITNVSDSTTSSYSGRKARRSLKAKKKPKIQPVYICPKCQSKYLVSSKKAIAISKCLKCDLWTSVNDAEKEEEEEEEVSVSFCCLS